MDALYELNDGKNLSELSEHNKIQKLALNALKKIKGTYIEELLHQHKLL